MFSTPFLESSPFPLRLSRGSFLPRQLPLHLPLAPLLPLVSLSQASSQHFRAGGNSRKMRKLRSACPGALRGPPNTGVAAPDLEPSLWLHQQCYPPPPATLPLISHAGEQVGASAMSHTQTCRLDILLKSSQLYISTQLLSVLTFIFSKGG